jgi:hypothetical protein
MSGGGDDSGHPIKVTLFQRRRKSAIASRAP